MMIERIKTIIEQCNKTEDKVNSREKIIIIILIVILMVGIIAFYLSLEEITEITLEFCKTIKESGYEPSIYGNAKTVTTKMKLELFNDYNKWYADYQEKPLYPYEFNLWQYTETGKVNGITGKVDLNIEFIKK